ncbi:MAG: TIGR02300 family protein [Pseudomonadota bacterium]|nr:TIGR02300 family protein [Pseudomonadota bacterium]
MAKPELGNKHQCQNCGARFFDLNKSPITCPKCGTVFQAAPLSRAAHHAAVADDEDTPAGAGIVLVPLDEADAGEDKVAVVADDDVEIEAADDTFLEEEEADADDVGDLIDGEIGDEEER